VSRWRDFHGNEAIAMIPTELRAPLAVLFLTLLTGSAAVGMALHVRGKAVAARQEAERAWTDAQARLERLPQRIALVRAMGGQPAELQRLGFVGSERRLDWISALAQTQQAFALHAVTWRLEPSRPTALPGLGVTRMHLSLTPMDPVQLGRWLAHLEGLGAGLYTVGQCDWALGEPPSMQCTLDWWNLKADGGAS
jgi:hypothetical protein